MPHTLIAPKRLKFGQRRALSEGYCLSYGMTMVHAELRVLTEPLSSTSRLVCDKLVQSILLWGFDWPGQSDRWALLRLFLATSEHVLEQTRLRGSAIAGARTSVNRYRFLDRLPAALLACICVDVCAPLASATVTVIDEKTGAKHGWTFWHGPLLSSLLTLQCQGSLPDYSVHYSPLPVWQPERAAIAANILPRALWTVLSTELSRLVWQYIVAPDEYSILYRLIYDAQPKTPPYLEMILAQCLHGELCVNTFPGQVFVFSAGTFCVLNAVCKVLEHLTGESPTAIGAAMRQHHLVLPDMVTVTIQPDAKREKPTILRGFLIPHAALHRLCQQGGRQYESLPWATDPPHMYTAPISLMIETRPEGAMYAD